MLRHRAVRGLEAWKQVHAREVDMRVDQTWQRYVALQVDTLYRAPPLAQRCGGSDVDDRPVTHGDGAVGVNPAFRVHGDDDAVLDQRVGKRWIGHAVAARARTDWTAVWIAGYRRTGLPGSNPAWAWTVLEDHSEATRASVT